MWNVTKCDEQEVFLRSLILLAGNQLKNRASVGRKLGILLGIDERNVETAIDEICTKYRHRRGLGKAFLKKVLAYEPPEAHLQRKSHLLVKKYHHPAQWSFTRDFDDIESKTRQPQSLFSR